MEFDPYSREVDSDPFTVYRWMRDHSPCHWSEAGQCWAITRYQDIVDAANDTETFSSARGNMLDDIPGRTGVTLGTTDPPRHDRLRMLINNAFLIKSNEYLKQPVIDLANAALDAVSGRDSFDFIRDFSSPVTVGALSYLLGIPEHEHRTIRDRVVKILQTDPATRKKPPESMEAFQWLIGFALELIAERQQNPGDDVISRLVTTEIDGEKLTPQEVQMTSATFIMAGVESASSFMTMLALNLADHPDARWRVVNNPERIADAMLESLRFNTSAQRFRRTVTKETKLHGRLMLPGQPVLLCFGSGNRDERKFVNPDDYDIDRRPRLHLGFGMGKHRCIGTHVADILVVNAMRVFLARVPDYHQVRDTLEWMPSTTFRSPVAYEIAVT